MSHSVRISGKDIYDEWGLIPTERPVVNPPQVKISFVELPGSSESIDYTEILTGKIPYGQRTGSWTFYFDSEWPGGDSDWKLRREGKLWAKIYSSLMTYTHGKTHEVVLEDDPDVTYTGRLTLSQWSSSGKFSQVTINYNLNPPEREDIDYDDTDEYDITNLEDV